MIDFMIIGLPRSGTTWAANWLTTDATHCVHDPLYTTHYQDWDSELPARAPHRRVGIACTGIWRWGDWLNQHPARKVILHRDEGEIRASMAAIGLPPLDPAAPRLLHQVIGLHVPYTDLFNPKHASRIWTYLTHRSFNEARHRELVQIEMQPQFAGLSVGQDVTRKLMDELYAAAR